MAICKSCGSSIPDDVPFCSYCGASLSGGLPPEGGIPPYPPQPVYGPPSIRPEPAPPYTPPVRSEPVPPYTQPYAPPYTQRVYDKVVSPTADIVWGAIMIALGLFNMLQLILGVIAVVFAATINNRMPPEEQKSKLRTARILNIVCTVLCVLTVISYIVIFGFVIASEGF